MNNKNIKKNPVGNLSFVLLSKHIKECLFNLPSFTKKFKTFEIFKS